MADGFFANDPAAYLRELQMRLNGSPNNVGAAPGPGFLDQMQRALPVQPATPPTFQTPATPPALGTMFAGNERPDMGAAAGGQLGMPPQAPAAQPQMPGFMQSGGGFLDGLHNAVLQNRGALAGIGAAIQSGRPVGYAALQGAEIDQKRQEEEDQKKRDKAFADATGEFLKDNPALARMLQADRTKAPLILKMAQDDKERTTLTEYQKRTLALQERKLKEGAGGHAGLNPVWGVDKDGNPVIMQLNSAGGITRAQLPEGVTLTKGLDKVDAGTETILIDPITRQPVGRVPKNLEQAEAAKERGQLGGQAATAAPAALDAADQTLTQIQNIRNDPALKSWWQGTGLGSVANAIPGTAGYDLRSKVNQVKAGSFLQAIQQMKGLGALSNAEGDKASRALERIDLGLGDKAFKEALTEYESVIKIAQQRIRNNQARYGGGAQAPAQGGEASGVIDLGGGVTMRAK